MGDQPGQANRVHRDRRSPPRRAPRPSAPPSGRRCRSACRPCRSWWSSMISAARMCLAASAANCIISTAPMAKFGATNTFAPAPRSVLELGGVEAGRADHDVDPGGQRLAGVGQRRVGHREVDQHVGVGLQRLGQRGRRAPGRRGPPAPCRRRRRRLRTRSRPSAPRRRPRPPGSARPRPQPPGVTSSPRAAGATPSSASSKRSRSGPMPAADSRSGAHSSSVSSARSSSVTASIRATTSSIGISGAPASTSEPRRFIRAPVDSSASTTRPLRFSLARASSSAVAGSARSARQLGADDRQGLHQVVGAGAHVQADLAGVVVGAGERVDGVGQAAALADLLEQP